jgi:hypothetical protein
MPSLVSDVTPATSISFPVMSDVLAMPISESRIKAKRSAGRSAAPFSNQLRPATLFQEEHDARDSERPSPEPDSKLSSRPGSHATLLAYDEPLCANSGRSMDASSFFKGARPSGLGVICENVERSLAQRGYDMRPIVVA